MISDREILKLLGSCADPFFGSFKSLTEVQRKSIPPILEGKDVLIASATASGKTEAIVAPMIRRLRLSLGPSDNPAIMMLVVAPTRALVNDLYKRLKWPLASLGWKCGRQTSDYSEKRYKPHVLITTPESFDSMLAHDVDRKGMDPVGHILDHVQALFLDEAHLYENSARGEHVAWLVARIKRLRKFAFLKGWTTNQSIQICAGTATVSQSSDLSRRLLGPQAEVIRVEGSREMSLYTPQLKRRWTSLASVGNLSDMLDLIKGAVATEEDLPDIVWGSISMPEQDGTRKALIFVPSRRLSDLVSASISAFLAGRRNIFVAGHHGSLDKSQREDAEKMFSDRRDAVLVATSTLEVGIDIGDVDIIVLYGAPADTSAFLQRIGRAGRRSGLIKLVVIAQNEIEVFAFASMIFFACRGIIEKSPPSKRWSVLVQQIVSLIMQSGGKGRKMTDIMELVETVWGSSSLETARIIIDHLIHENLIFITGNRLRLGEKFSDDMLVNRSYYHCNFDTGANTLPVVDQLTGQTIGHVRPELLKSTHVAIGGRSVDVVHSGDQILVRTQRNQASTTFRYDARRPAVSKSFAEHVRTGLGFEDNETLVVESPDLGPVWFHFAGEMYEWILCKILEAYPCSHFKQRGLALLGRPTEDGLRNMNSRISEIRESLSEIDKLVERLMGVGRFHKYLPDHVKTEVTTTMFDVDSFIHWSMSRKIRPIHHGSPLWPETNRLLQQICRSNHPEPTEANPVTP